MSTLPVPAEPATSRLPLLRTILRNPLAVAASAVLTVFTVVALTQQWLTPHPPSLVMAERANALPFTGAFLLGGDFTGRDILSRLLAGTTGALTAALIMTSVALVIGIVCGLLAGYFGGVWDLVGNWLFSVLLAAPGIIILLALYTVVDASLPVAMLALGIISSPSVFLLVRTLTRTVRRELYVDAARVSGLSNLRIVGRHVLIAIKGPIVILAAFLAGSAIAASSGLEFLGLGEPTVPSWGGMLNDAFGNIYIAPWQLLFPGGALVLVMASFVLLGNAIRDAAGGGHDRPDPRGRRMASAAVRSTDDGRQPTERRAAGRAPLLAIERLRIAYPARGALTTVVDDVSLVVQEGEIVGLVGESGSGKTQTVFAALGLLPEQAVVVHGSIELLGSELIGLDDRALAPQRGSIMSYVPQEPMSNLDPTFTVGSQMVEGIRAQRAISRSDARRLALDTLDRVGIKDPVRTFRSYPFQISGGMAQRVLIASAVANAPRLLIADEPTTALDVTVQAEVLDLLRSLQRESGMGMLLVTHNLGVVADLCDRVVVMRDGRIIEEGAVSQVFTAPRDEYTKTLLESVLDTAELRPPLGVERSKKEDRR